MSEEPFDPENPEANPVLDEATFTKLATIIGSGPDGIGQLVDTFAETTPETVQEMRDAADENDMERFSKAAHKLKGEAGTFGARRLQALCKRLELDAREGNLDDPHDHADAVEALLEGTINKIRTLL